MWRAGGGGGAGYIQCGRPAFSKGGMNVLCDCLRAAGRLLDFTSHTRDERMGELICVLRDRSVKISGRELC